MLLRWLLASLHLAALVFGSAAILARARTFAAPLDRPALRRLFAADSWWGLAALVWISTGLWRLFASTEKPVAFYLQSQAFWLKMGILAVILLLEIWPMMALVRWRVALRREQPLDTSRAGVFAAISHLQFLLVILMVFAATAMARGLGF